MKQRVKRCLSILLTLVFVFGMLPATVMAAEAGLPIYFFIARPGEDPDPDNGWYADYPGYTKGSAKATLAASSLDGDGIRNVNDEQIIKNYIIESTLPGGSLAAFEDFGSQRLTFSNGWNSSSDTYSSDEYDIVWVAISLKTGYNRNPYRCWCSGVTSEHIHIDGVLSKKVEVTKETIKLTKSISDPAGVGGETFNFNLVKLQQDANYNPTAVVDPLFTPVAMQAVIAAGQTSASIEPVSGSVDDLTFGYYQLVEVDEPVWEPEDPVYIHIATDGSIKYSHTLSASSFVSMSNGATMENALQTYTVTYRDGLTPASFATVVKTGLLYGVSTPVYEGGTPEYADGSKSFSGWLHDKDNDGVQDLGEPVLTSAQIAATTVTDDAVYVAQWADNTYTVTWVDDDDTTVLETDSNVLYGTTPTYNNGGGTTAQLAAAKGDAQYSYTFTGWRSSLTGTLFTPGDTLPPVTDDVTYIANYAPTLNSYTVTWNNYDGTLLETDANVAYGDTPTYDNSLGKGTTAQLAYALSGAQYTYRFNGWTPAVSPVTGNITYTATFVPTVNRYTVTWQDHNGTVLGTDSVAYGARPAYTGTEPGRASTAYFSYTFTGWKNSSGTDANVYPSNGAFPAVTGNVTYVAQYAQERLLFTGTVNVHLDNALITAPTTLQTLLGSGVKMYLGNGTDFYELTQSPTAYHAYQNTEMPNGNYYVYTSSNGVHFTQLCEQVMTIDNANRERDSFFWSVNYHANGGTGAPAAAYYHDESAAAVSQTVPTRSGYIFLGWEYGAAVYQPGDKLTDQIGVRYDLVAQWVDSVDVKVNVYLDHTAASGGYDTDAASKDDVVVHLVEQVGSGIWTETGHALTLSDNNHPKHRLETDPVGAAAADALSIYYIAQDAVPTFVGLRGDKSYTVTASKNHYEVSSVTPVQDPVTGDWTIQVNLKYAPEDFDLAFSVQMAPGIPSEFHPTAVIVKALYWNPGSGAWETITQQEGTLPGVRVDLVNGSGTGSVTVPGMYGLNNPYGYRISVVSFVYDGATVPASTGDYVTYVDANGLYTAVMQDVTGGKLYGAGLDGAYYNGSAQSGALVAEVSLNAYSVNFHANHANAAINGLSTYTLPGQYKAPDNLSGYVPVHSDSGYVFGGWYMNSACTVPAVTGQRLTGDVNFYAKWIAPFTVQGTVEVDGYYTLNSTNIPIPSGDRIGEVTVLLQKYHPSSGYFATLRTAKVSLNYVSNIAAVNYEFTGVPNDGSIYRVQVLSHNYSDTYLNETAAAYGQTLNNTTTCPSLAVDYDANSAAVVNVHMEFDPDEFDLWYMVDASAIGAGFRPEKATVLVLCDDNLTDSTSPRQWPVISQMASGGVEITVGTAAKYPVWKFHPLNYPYDYAIKVDGVKGWTLDGTEPFTVEYNGTAEYANPGYEAGKTQTQLLVAALKPKTYPITYYLMQGSDNILPGMTVTSHTWSVKDTVLTDTPTRVGYVFTGWVDALGNPVTAIPAGTHAETKVYATWKADNWKDDNVNGDALTGGDGIPDEQQVRILYTAGSYGSTDPVFEIVTITGSVFSDVTVSATSGSTPAASAGYAFDKWAYIGSSDTADNATAAFTPGAGHAIAPVIENADGGKTYTFEVSFDVDDKGDENTGGSDGIPDKYQAFVEFISGNTDHGTVTGSIHQTFNFGPATSGAVDPDLSGVTVSPAAKYAFDHWHHNGANLTHLQAEAPFTGEGGKTYVFSAHFSVDEWTDDDVNGDSDQTGDGIPDNRQVLVKYIPTANHLGTVTGSTVQVFTLTPNAGGAYIGDIDPDDNVTVSGSTGYAFDYWGDPDGFWGPAGGKVTEAQAFGVHRNVPGGRTLVYVAHFGADKWDDADDNETDGDGTPDSRQILLRYASSDPTKGTVSPATEVITLTGAVSCTAGGSIASALSGYAFDHWAYIQSDDVNYTPSNPVLTPVIINPVGGHAYEFFAAFDTDVKGGGTDGETPDGIPDKHQAIVKFVSADTTLGTVTGSGIVQTFTFRDSAGNYTSSGFVAPSLANVTVSTLNGSTFSHWTINEDPTKLSSSEIESGSDNVPGGVTITVAAHFDEYVYVPTTGTVILTKVDSVDTDKTLSGVVFDLYRTNGTKIGTYTTDANGQIIETLPAGMYYWKEIRPSEGYMMLTDPQPFSIEAGYTNRMTLTNTHAKVPSAFGTDHYAFVIGSTDGLVHPEANITRAEVATIYFRMLNEETRSRYLTTSNSFSDVHEGDWYNTAVSTMAAMGVIGGYPDGTFRPSGNITRAEFIAFAAHFDPDGNRSSSAFTDIEGHWAEVEINIAANNGWTLGDGTNLFRPDTLINRAEAMALINRVLQRIPETTHDLLDYMVVWPDNMDTSKWYYLAVQEASNSHLYIRKPNGYEFWTELTTVPDWTKYER